MHKDTLSKLLNPRSVILYGVTPPSKKMLSRLVKHLDDFNYTGNIFPVMQDHDKMAGIKCYGDILEVPGSPDVLIIADINGNFRDIVEKCGKKTIPFVIVLDSGTAIYGDNEYWAEIKRIAAENNVRILGPESQGIVNFYDAVPMTGSPLVYSHGEPCGGTAYLSQSGTFGFVSYTAAAARGVNFRYVITTGHEIDLDILDLTEFIIDDPGVNLILLCIDELRDGRRFLSIVEAARERKTAVAVLRTGKHRLSSPQSSSATAVLSDDERLWNSALEQYGVIEIHDVHEIPGLAWLFDLKTRPSGPRVGILSTSVGAGALMYDHCRKADLLVEPLSLQRSSLFHVDRLKLQEFNPLVISNSTLEDPKEFSFNLQTLAESDEIDLVVVIITLFFPETSSAITGSIQKIFHDRQKTLVCVWLPAGDHNSEGMKELRRHGVPVYENISFCSRAIGAFAKWSCFKKDIAEVSCENILPSLDLIPGEFTEYSAKKFLSTLDLQITKEKLCYSLEEVLEYADELGYPVALKVMSPDILRKSEARIIALDLKDEEEVRNAYGRVLERAVKSNSNARISGVLVQEMINGGIECMIGARRDRIFGPVISVGLGGIYVEFLDDYSSMLAPVSVIKATEMICSLRGAPLLKGLWGRKGMCVSSLAEMVSRVSSVIDCDCTIEEININPVITREEDSVIVDAFIVRR